MKFNPLKPLSLAVTKQSSVHWLHAAGTGEAPHEPVVDALHVVGVHAGQVPHTVPHAELDHADDAPEEDVYNKLGVSD